MKLINFNQAVNALEQGEIIAYPTETFYAIGGLALSPNASKLVFKAKSRQQSSPLPVIIGDLNQLPLLAIDITESALDLAKQFWPGPLSILFKTGPLVPAELSCNTVEVAVRQTPHAGAVSLCMACGPLSASSANLSGEPAVIEPNLFSPALTEHLAGIIELLPKPAGGLPSTLIKILEDNSLQILRQGAISEHALIAAGWRIKIL